jgi:hypothetical protein
VFFRVGMQQIGNLEDDFGNLAVKHSVGNDNGRQFFFDHIHHMWMVLDESLHKPHFRIREGF